jgi:nitrite reductase (cytochrome c-552)
MTTSQQPPRSRQWPLLVGAFLVGMLIMAGLAALLVNIQQRKAEAVEYPLRVVEMAEDELDPAVWGQNFPRQYDSYMRTQEDTFQSPHGGSVPFSRLERFPAAVRNWAGYAFSKEYNEERGHYYAQIDQENTERVKIVEQPGACINCHAAEAPGLIAEMGWEEFNRTPYNDHLDNIHTGSSCADCHDPQTMDLRITRPAFLHALEERGINLEEATRQEMRTYVCAQCHVEYYFAGENKVLTFPWDNGLNVDQIDDYYTEIGFTDWTHGETNAPMIKIQHPDYELWSTGLHATSGVACADCHMPYVRDGAVKVSNHHVRSPHGRPDHLPELPPGIGRDAAHRVLTIQDRTAESTPTDRRSASRRNGRHCRRAGHWRDRRAAGASPLPPPPRLPALGLHLSENSTGFHSPQESARILALSIDLARQAQLEAERVQITVRAN